MLFDWLNFRESTAFTNKVIEIAERLEIKPDSLMAVIWVESQFNKLAVNPVSNALGLIQCLPSTLRNLGISAIQVKQMTGTQQLEKVVYPYLKPYIGRMIRPIDVYLAVFFPLAIGHRDAYVLSKTGENAYRWNLVIDTKYGDDNGKLEVFDIRCFLNNRILRAVQAHRRNYKFRAKIPQYYEFTVF